MRRLIPVVVVLVLTLAPAACHRPQPRVDLIEDENRPPLSAVEAANPRGAVQLLSGFYDVEQNAWRWTMAKFAVILQPPAGAARNGARLELALSVPEPLITRRQSVTLSAAVEGRPLAPETYTKAGQYTYSRDVPGTALGVGAVKIDFALDKFLASGEIEHRELGIVVRSVALLSK